MDFKLINKAIKRLYFHVIALLILFIIFYVNLNWTYLLIQMADYDRID